MRRQAPLLVILLACGRSAGTSEKAAPHREDGGEPSADARTVATLDVLPAPGMQRLADFAYRTRGGQDAFRRARQAEAKGDWTAVAESCRRALDADPTHLDAMYLLAVALAKTGASPNEIVVPLAGAVA